MATETGPDLSYAVTVYESLMDDTCTITRPGDPEDGVYNPVTRQIEAPTTNVHVDIPCMVSSITADVAEQTGLDLGADTYEVEVSVDHDDIEIDDIVLVTSARRDLGMVGLRLKVNHILYETFAISRLLMCEVDR